MLQVSPCHMSPIDIIDKSMWATTYSITGSSGSSAGTSNHVSVVLLVGTDCHTTVNPEQLNGKVSMSWICGVMMS